MNCGKYAKLKGMDVTMRRRLLLCLVVVLALGTLLSGIAHAGTSGVAQAGAVIPGVFNSYTLAGNDDSYTDLVSLGFSANFFGTTYTGLYVNNNGNVTFDTGLSTYTPFGLTSNIGTPIIAPFFADVDTRAGNAVTYGTGTYEGHNAFGVNWIDVGYYGEHTDKLNSFQLILIDRSDIASGDFDIMFNYDQIQWETGDASDGSGGLGGSSAHVGYSNGSGDSGTYYEFNGSGVNGALLDGGSDALISNSNVGVDGRYVFEVRSGYIHYSRYDFTYYYNNGSGDSYTGSVYALTGYNGYQVGYTQTNTDENLQSGYYNITAATDLGSDSSQAGQVYVTSYYDQESNQTYTPVSNGTAVGTNYLGSEHDYIIQSGVPEYLFGSSDGTFYEADVSSSYSSYDFTYYYNNGSGDYYSGWIYAPTGYNGYQVGYKQTTSADENGQAGYYQITAVTDSGSDGSKDGKVYVTSYYDAETGTTYTPVSFGSAVGTNYLGSEHDYIIQSGVPEFYFGGGYYEADVGDYSRYDFQYYYNNGSGDYYTGYVFAPTSFKTFLTVGTSLYDQPQPLWASGYVSLNGGYYYITGITDGFSSSYDKESYITSYYDADTAGASLGVNYVTDGYSSASYVADRTLVWEYCYAISGSNQDTFSVYKEADVSSGSAASTSPSAPALTYSGNQAVWAAYWSQTPNLLEDEK
jgi:hypothetical protein